MSVDVPGRDFNALRPPREGVCGVARPAEQRGDRHPQYLSNLCAELECWASAQQIHVRTDRDRHALHRLMIAEASDPLALRAQIQPDFLQCFTLGGGTEIDVA